MATITELDIIGHTGRPTPNRFFKQDRATTRLGIVLPGLGYSADMPLLYYSTRLLLDHGADVLQLRANYMTAEFEALPGEERARWTHADATALVHAGLVERDYEQITLVGKSIGTLAMAHILSTEPRFAKAAALWLTPLLHRPRLVEAARKHHGPSLLIAGTDDSVYDAAALAQIREATGAETFVVEGADHGMEIAGDLVRSVQVIERIVRAVADWLERIK
jgi:pimeloyl-ACP methyl ester carboxylesterase